MADEEEEEQAISQAFDTFVATRIGRTVSASKKAMLNQKQEKECLQAKTVSRHRGRGSSRGGSRGMRGKTAQIPSILYNSYTNHCTIASIL